MSIGFQTTKDDFSGFRPQLGLSNAIVNPDEHQACPRSLMRETELEHGEATMYVGNLSDGEEEEHKQQVRI